MAALAGVGVGGAVGGVTGALVGMGIPEYEAKRYEGRVKDGGILLSVHSDDSQWTKKAKEILKQKMPVSTRSTPVPSATPAPIAPAVQKAPILQEDQSSSNEANSLEKGEWDAVQITQFLWKRATTPREVTRQTLS